MQGLQLTADIHDCSAERPFLNDPQALRALCLGLVHDAGLTAVADVFHHFDAQGGVTGVVLLAESHLAVHTWPELQAATLDVYVCNFGGDNSRRAESLMAALTKAFAPGRVERHRLVRGAMA